MGNSISIFFLIEAVGTIAFASSGAMVAIRQNLDLLGIIVLGVTTAGGGGGGCGDPFRDRSSQPLYKPDLHDHGIYYCHGPFYRHPYEPAFPGR